MKTIHFYKIVFVLSLLFCFSKQMYSQGPPPWAKAHGFRAKTRYVYLPEQNFYYDIQKRNYIYLSNNNWEVSVSLPSIFVGVNLGNASQVELDFYGSNPYRYNEVHLVKYKKAKKIKIYKEDNNRNFEKGYKKKEKKHKH